jgi:spore maturation protein CgeB
MRKWRGRPPASKIGELNRAILIEARSFQPALTFFVKAAHIFPETLQSLAGISSRFVYMNDDMFNPANQTPTFAATIGLFDCILTTKSYNVREFQAGGAPRAVYIPNAYDPRIHFPAQPSSAEQRKMGGDVAFIGTFRPSRADLLERIARYREFKFNVWGGGWRKMARFDNLHKRHAWHHLRSCVRPHELWCADMGKAIQSNSVILGLLHHLNRDLQTSRSFEIPACGGFMLAERTEEHRMYFEEDKEAVYFDCFEELISKLRFYVAHDGPRLRIARAALRRCEQSPYRYVDRARFALELLKKFGRPRASDANCTGPLVAF